MSSLESNASKCGRGEDLEPEPGFATKVCVLFLGRCRRSPSPIPSALSPFKLCLRRLPAATGGGYVHSLPECSHDRQVVPTPLFTHLTFDRRQRMQAMLERIRPRSVCPNEGPAAAYVGPEEEYEAKAVFGTVGELSTSSISREPASRTDSWFICTQQLTWKGTTLAGRTCCLGPVTLRQETELYSRRSVLRSGLRCSIRIGVKDRSHAG